MLVADDQVSPSLGAQIVRKGSIAMDGISLTVAGVDEKRFDVQIVPFTWEHTNLKRPGCTTW